MAVFTPLAKRDLESFLTYYSLESLSSAQGIVEGVENTNYLLKLGKFNVPYILTVFERRVNPRDLPFFLSLTEWLSEKGIACPRPLRGKNDQMVYPLKEKPAALVEFIEGTNKPVINLAHVTLVGELMARLHLAAEGFPMTRRNVLSLGGWNSLFVRFRGRANEISPDLEDFLSEELQFLDNNWPENLPHGIIHADVFPDNVFFHEGSSPELSGIIDFYFACNDFWMYDLAVAMNAWCFDEQHQFIPERAKALFVAYNHQRSLTKEEQRALPVLARGAAMRFVVTRCLDWLNHVEGTQVVPKDPMEYITKLRFHQQVKKASEYGL